MKCLGKKFTGLCIVVFSCTRPCRVWGVTVTALAKDPEILNANISIISYQMSMESTGMYGDYNKGIAGRFRFELLSPKNIAFKSAAAQQEMKDLHSDGNGAGWAMLCKRYKLKVRGNSTKMWNVLELEEFNQYK